MQAPQASWWHDAGKSPFATGPDAQAEPMKNFLFALITAACFPAALMAQEKGRGAVQGLPVETRAGYSALIPAALAILPNLAISLLMCAANCSGVLDATSSPRVLSVAFSSAFPNTLTASAFSRLMIAAGVPAGTSNPNHEVISKSGSPASGIVGTSGSRLARLCTVTASGLTFPALICEPMYTTLENIIDTSPPRRA